MKEFSTETIEIDGKEYKLFLNRRGLTAFENASKLVKIAAKAQDKYLNDDEEIDGNGNPYELYGEDEEIKEMEEVIIKFYWIALYENHHLTLDEVRPLYEQAKKEYGLEQLIELSNQIIEDINTNQSEVTELKKLTALRPKKK